MKSTPLRGLIMIKVDVLEDSTAIARANELHSIRFMERDYAKLPKSLDPVIEKNSDYFMFSSKVPFPVMNAVMCLNRNAEFSSKKVKEIAAFLEGRADMQMWYLGASQLGFGVYQRVGFKEYYKMNMCVG